MKVGELIELLQQHNESDDVHICFPAGDYWRTIIAGKVSEVSQSMVKYSGYHDNDVLASEFSDQDESNCRMVVIIR